MIHFRLTRLLPLAVAAFVAASFLPTWQARAETQIRYVVNNTPVTNYDIQRRAAFLKLQHKPGGEKAAADDMIEQALKTEEIQRLNIKVPDKQVDEAFAKFAAGNKLAPKQMSDILNRMGVTAGHFKDFIRVQIGWNQALGIRYRSKGQISEQDAVQRMQKEGGVKPTATEYVLQQVIFVVPQAERNALLAKRKREAEAMRLRFAGCDTTRQLAKGVIDVTVRDLGKVLAPELPAEWADNIKAIKSGAATPVHETPRGVEFIGICNMREVSDDRVARLVFQTQGTDKDKADKISVDYLAELHTKAKIVQR